MTTTARRLPRTRLPRIGARPGLRRPRLPRLTGRRAAVLAVLVLALGGAWLWLRSSSLVRIRQVEVTGVSGRDAATIRADLIAAAERMTTLDVSRSALLAAVARFPHVAGLTVHTHLPHGVTLAVTEDIPLAVISSDGRPVAVDAAGQLLPAAVVGDLPRLPIAPDAGGTRITDPGTLAVLAVLARAPWQLLAHLASARSTAHHGVAVQLRDGPVIYFGDTTDAAAKWAAADGVLAASASAGAAYIDVSAPDRPAAG